MKAICLLFFALPLFAAAPPLTTLAERTQWKQTGRYAEATQLCEAFPKAFPGQARCFTFGKSAEGRPMVGLVVSSDGTLNPKAAQKKNRPVLFIQGGIHAGEIDGKDAGFLALREMLAKEQIPEGLAKSTVVFVPVFNVDGHERFGKWNRPNQVGPEEMGWRTTAQNLNLNRDYMKAEAPEMAAMIAWLREWDPVLYVDLHVTDGADFQLGVSVTVQPSRYGPKKLRQVGEEVREKMMGRLKKLGHLAVDFYPSFRKDDDPTSGFEEYAPLPRFSHAYWALHNRIGVLVETHSWKDYATRVKLTHDTILQLVDLARLEGRDWLSAVHATEKSEMSLGGDDVPLTFAATDKTKTISFPGYAYKREPSPVSGGFRVTYDPSKPEVWKVPFYYELKPKKEVRAPKGGYLVPAAYAGWVSEKLKIHGIGYELVDKTRTLDVETFRATEAVLAKNTFEGKTALAVQGEWKREKREVVKGSLYVPLTQPLSRLAVNLFEPEAPDSLVAWGYFNSAFERKEYMEAYVAEGLADTMLKDPKVEKEFKARVEADAEFAKDPEKRLDFFYTRHPSWDERYRLYPVYRAPRSPNP